MRGTRGRWRRASVCAALGLALLAGCGGGGGNSGGGSYNLTVKLDVWVHVYDKNGSLIKKVRLDNAGKAKFNAIKSKYNPYKIEVYSYNKLLYTDTYQMPKKNTTYSVK